MAENKNCTVISAKRIQLSTSTDDLQSEEYTDPNSTRSPEESVFSIAHILESIFSKCDRQTLKKCRLVSRRWAYYGSKQFQKTVQIGLLETIFQIKYKNEPKYFHSSSNGTRSMEDLITLMNNSEEFPVHSFKLTRVYEYKTQLGTQSFLDAHGAFIKKIAFGGFLCLDDLKQLLFSNKAPNLEHLSLENVFINNKNSVNNSITHGQGLERRRLEEYLYDEHIGGSMPILRTLKEFNCSFDGGIPAIFIAQILECSPNLVEVVLPEECLHFLIQPTNRLHLLKKLKMRIDNTSVEAVDVVANEHEGNWAVRELEYLPYMNDRRFSGGAYTPFSLRVTSILSKIYNGISATCRKLDLGNGEHPEIVKFPQMPQVECLTIRYSDKEKPGFAVNFLSESVSLQDVFPNLKWLKINFDASMEQNLRIENIFGSKDPAPVPSVKKVILRLFNLSEQLRQSFKTKFPNATIHNGFIFNPGDDV